VTVAASAPFVYGSYTSITVVETATVVGAEGVVAGATVVEPGGSVMGGLTEGNVARGVVVPLVDLEFEREAQLTRPGSNIKAPTM
jgi:hypothetical protein